MGNVDQDGFDNQHSDGGGGGGGPGGPAEWLDASAAAALLGVKLPTLYAYASRGLLRSAPAAPGAPAAPRGGRARRYLREDLERLKARAAARAGHGPVAASALRWGEPVLESAITAVGPEGPRYRGRAAVELARAGVSFEQAAELLWTGTLPEERPAWRSAAPPSDQPWLRALERLAGDGGALAALQLFVAARGAADPARFSAPDEAELARARPLILELAAALSLGHDPSRLRQALAAHSVAAALSRALGGPEDRASLGAIDAALTLLADHELNASTFAARVAASTGADLYACVGAGLCALSGPRHGAASERVEALLQEVGARPGAGRPAQVVRERLRRGEEIPGLQHQLYPDGDPRAAPLLEIARRRAPRSAPLRALLAIVAEAEALGQGRPNVDTALVALSLALGLPRGAATAIFAVARCAGWVAHALEQRRSPHLLRPRARYVGP